MRIGLMGKMSDKKLPYDSEVEYLESFGNEYIYIDNVYLERNIPFKIDFMSKKGFDYDAGKVFGSQYRKSLWSEGSGKRTDISYYTDEGIIISRLYGYNTNVRGAYSRNVIYWNGNETLTINGIQYRYETEQSDFEYYNVGVGLFCAALRLIPQMSLEMTEKIGMFLYSFSIGVRKFIPVRKEEVGYLYDQISGKLYGNLGTGAFAIGPDTSSGGGEIDLTRIKLFHKRFSSEELVV